MGNQKNDIPVIEELKVRHLQKVSRFPAHYTKHAINQSQVDVARVRSAIKFSQELVDHSNTRYGNSE